MVKLTPFTDNEIASMSGKWTHYAIIDAKLGDLTVSVVTTEQVFPLFTPLAGDWIKAVGILVTESFQNTADAAYNSTTIRIGDTNDDDQFIVAQEMNTNGTVVPFGYNTGDALPFTYLTATLHGIVATVGDTSGKKLTDLNRGRVVILFDIFRPSKPMLNRSTGGAYAATGAQGDI